jgi:hypothetical protein
MKKTLKVIAVILLTSLAAFSVMLPVKSQVPLLPMTLYGYVTINRSDGTNVTAPPGLYVYAKENGTITNAIGTWTTDAVGHYNIGCSATTDGTTIDIWVQNINVTRITFHSGTFLELNLTVADSSPPIIEILSPQQGETVGLNQSVWINATLTDDLAINASTIKMTLNETQLNATYNSATGLLHYQTDPLDGGLYIVSLFTEDLAGNNASETLNFTVALSQAPTISILTPSTANPIYTQSGKPIQIAVNYTELNPSNSTLKIYNSTETIIEISNTTVIASGTNITDIIEVAIPSATSEGSYSVSVNLTNIYNLSTTAAQQNAITVDNTSPAISSPYQEPPGQTVQPNVTIQIQNGLNVTIKVNVTDALSPVEQVTLFYNTTATQWENVTMHKTSGNEYAATTPASQLPVGTTIAYYIEAYDTADNMAKTPTTEIYFQYQVIPEFPMSMLLTIMALFTAAALIYIRRKGNNK